MQVDSAAIHEQVRQRCARVATDPNSETRFELGRASAVKLGYDGPELDDLPSTAVDSFAGVGNPLLLAPLTEGMTVLDLGCGSGVDMMIASRAVGPSGRVIGIDMTDEMLDKARQACAEARCANVEIKKGMAHDLDLEDGLIDVIVSNGVINLCPDKEKVVAELYRVLKPGGRLQVADMSLMDGVNPELLERVGEWSD